jgi:hypothetical protein
VLEQIIKLVPHIEGGAKAVATYDIACSAASYWSTAFDGSSAEDFL